MHCHLNVKKDVTPCWLAVTRASEEYTAFIFAVNYSKKSECSSHLLGSEDTLQSCSSNTSNYVSVYMVTT